MWLSSEVGRACDAGRWTPIHLSTAALASREKPSTRGGEERSSSERCTRSLRRKLSRQGFSEVSDEERREKSQVGRKRRKSSQAIQPPELKSDCAGKKSSPLSPLLLPEAAGLPSPAVPLLSLSQGEGLHGTRRVGRRRRRGPGSGLCLAPSDLRQRVFPQKGGMAPWAFRGSLLAAKALSVSELLRTSVCSLVKWAQTQNNVTACLHRCG